MNKNITVIKAESGQLHDLAIAPGTTARDILTQVGLGNRYVLSNGRGQEPFGDDENVFEAVANGTKLYASTPVEVGAGGGVAPPFPQAKTIPETVSFWSRAIQFITSIFADDADSKPCAAAVSGDVAQKPAPKLQQRRDGKVLVQRDTRPFWQQRGWKQNERDFHGYYRTRFGSWRGKAKVSPSGRIDLYILKPPEALQAHPHWQCFNSWTGKWYSIHHHGAADLSSAIIEIERILTQSLARAL